MKNRRVEKAFQALAHPITISAMVMILLNALVFQPLAPSWLTGKLADLAWMVVLPLLLALLLAPLRRSNQKKAFFMAAGLSALILIALKVFPPTNNLVNTLSQTAFNTSLKLRLDPTDLLALAGMPLAWWIWRQPWQLTRRIWRFAPLALLVMVSLADAADPGYDQIDCLAVHQDSVIAFTPERSTSYTGKVSRKAYISSDNGQTWSDLTMVSKDEEEKVEQETGIPLVDLMAQCPNSVTGLKINDPDMPTTEYLIVSGKGVYRSEDAGETLIRELAVEEDVDFRDVLYTPDGETMVIAAGYYGVLLRHPDGTYTWVDPSGIAWER